MIEGKRIPDIDLVDLFKNEDAHIDLIYGRVGQGKTYAATADILDRLSRGGVVYANWKIDYRGDDQRTSLVYILLGLLGIKRRFYRFDAKNLHYLPIDENFMDIFEKLTDCSVYLDEGHIIFDSYQHTKFSLRKRTSILHTRHFNRSLVIVSQRPTAIHVSARGNVERFFKVERWLKWPFLLFTKTEYQDMVNDTVDETKPIRTSLYMGDMAIMRAYSSKYMRGDTPDSQKVNFEAYNVGWLRSWGLLWNYLRGNSYTQDINSEPSPLGDGDAATINTMNKSSMVVTDLDSVGEQREIHHISKHLVNLRERI